MNKFFIILIHTFLSKVKTKSFLVTNLITIAIVILLANMPNIIEFFNEDSKDEKIAVIDETGKLLPLLKEQLKEMNKDYSLEAFDGAMADAEKKVKEEVFDGALELSFDENGLPQAAFSAMTIAETITPGDLKAGLQQIKTMMASSEMNLAQEQLGKLFEPVMFEQTALEKNAKTEKELNQARGLVYILLFVIYFAVLMYGNMIAMEVATEKTSRVMEILISSVSPVKQMFAKILGVGLLSITQIIILFTAGYFSIRQNIETLKNTGIDFFDFSNVPTTTIAYAIIFFVLGYFLYATLAAFLGSLVSRVEDVQQSVAPMSLLIVAGFMIAMFGLTNPDEPFITVTSYIPFFTPMIMFLRVGMLNLPFWEAALGIFLMVVTIVVLAVFGARVYRGGVLMYGKSNFIKDIKQAMQLAKKE